MGIIGSGIVAVAVIVGLVLAIVIAVGFIVMGFRLITHIARFVRGEVGDALRFVGALLLLVFYIPMAVLSLVIARFSAASHYGRAIQDEITTAGKCLYRVVIGHPLRLFGLGGLTEGLEQRLPDVMAGAPTADLPVRGRAGQFEGYSIIGSLPTGGSGAKLYIAEPDATRRTILARDGFADVDRVVIKAFSLTEGSSLPQIVRESRSLDAAKRLGLILDHAMGQERFHYVMRYVPGDSLSMATRRLHAESAPGGLDPRALRAAVAYVSDIVDTLSIYHKGGLWHKDVKPDNIIIDHRDGRAHLVDFGLVSSLRSAMTLTTHGTEYFRDPEMVRLALRGVKVHEVDGTRFDIYGVGAVLYSVIEDSFPAHGELSQVTKRCPETIKWIIRRAMANYDKRYDSAALMLADLNAVLSAPDPFAMRPVDLPSMSALGDDSSIGDGPVRQSESRFSAIGGSVGAAGAATSAGGEAWRLCDWRKGKSAKQLDVWERWAAPDGEAGRLGFRLSSEESCQLWAHEVECGRFINMKRWVKLAEAAVAAADARKAEAGKVAAASAATWAGSVGAAAARAMGGAASPVREAPKIHVTNWWSGEALREAPAQASVRVAASPVAAPVVQPMSPSRWIDPRATAAFRGRTAPEIRAAASARRAAFQAGRRGGGTPAGLNWGLGVAVFVVLGGLGTLVVESLKQSKDSAENADFMSHVDVPVPMETEAGEALARAIALTEAAIEDAAVRAEVALENAQATIEASAGGLPAIVVSAAAKPSAGPESPFAGTRVLIVSDVLAPRTPEAEEMISRIESALRSQGYVVSGNLLPLPAATLTTEAATDRAAVDAENELLASVRMSMGQVPTDSLEAKTKIQAWMAAQKSRGGQTADIVMWISPPASKDVLTPRVVVFASEQLGSQKENRRVARAASRVRLMVKALVSEQGR
jgi:hypothetical protein